MNGAGSRAKGNKAEQKVARFLRTLGYADALTTRDARGGAQGGADITGVPGWAIEIKDQTKPMLLNWWHQAHQQADDTEQALLVWHQPGVKDPAGWVAIWPVQYDNRFPETHTAPTARDYAAFTLLTRPVMTKLAGYFVTAGSLSTWWTYGVNT